MGASGARSAATPDSPRAGVLFARSADVGAHADARARACTRACLDLRMRSQACTVWVYVAPACKYRCCRHARDYDRRHGRYESASFSMPCRSWLSQAFGSAWSFRSASKGCRRA